MTGSGPRGPSCFAGPRGVRKRDSRRAENASAPSGCRPARGDRAVGLADADYRWSTRAVTVRQVQSVPDRRRSDHARRRWSSPETFRYRYRSGKYVLHHSWLPPSDHSAYRAVGVRGLRHVHIGEPPRADDGHFDGDGRLLARPALLLPSRRCCVGLILNAGWPCRRSSLTAPGMNRAAIPGRCRLRARRGAVARRGCRSGWPRACTQVPSHCRSCWLARHTTNARDPLLITCGSGAPVSQRRPMSITCPYCSLRGGQLPPTVSCSSHAARSRSMASLRTARLSSRTRSRAAARRRSRSSLTPTLSPQPRHPDGTPLGSS